MEKIHFACDWCRGSDEGIEDKEVSKVVLHSHYLIRKRESKPVNYKASNGKLFKFCCEKCKESYLKSADEFRWISDERP